MVGQAKEERNAPTLDAAEKQQVQRANQIFLRLRKQLHDRNGQFAERDAREAAQAARWLEQIVERHPGGWEGAYEDTLAESGLPEEDRSDLQRRVEEAGGFETLVRRDLRRLEEINAPATEMARRDLVCGVAAGLLAGGTMLGIPFYFSFVLGMSRKAGCW